MMPCQDSTTHIICESHSIQIKMHDHKKFQGGTKIATFIVPDPSWRNSIQYVFRIWKINTKENIYAIHIILEIIHVIIKYLQICTHELLLISLRILYIYTNSTYQTTSNLSNIVILLQIFDAGTTVKKYISTDDTFPNSGNVIQAWKWNLKLSSHHDSLEWIFLSGECMNLHIFSLRSNHRRSSCTDHNFLNRSSSSSLWKSWTKSKGLVG